MAERSRPILGAVLGPLMRWARNKSRVGLAVVGALPGSAAEGWAVPRALPIGLPTDAPGPQQADLLVVVGRISHKLAPFLVRTHAAMARPTSVMVIELEAKDGVVPRLYATVGDIASIIPVDVVVRGHPPSAAALARAVRTLDDVITGLAP